MAKMSVKDDRDNYSRFTDHTSNEISPTNFSNNFINYEYYNNFDYQQYYEYASQQSYLMSNYFIE